MLTFRATRDQHGQVEQVLGIITDPFGVFDKAHQYQTGRELGCTMD